MPPLAEEAPAIEAAAREVRRLVLDMAASDVGCHLGGSLSVVELLLAAHARADRTPGSEVILSKGHAAAALYAALHVRGTIAENPAPLYGRAGSPYTGHPGPLVEGVRFATGSLGHGLGYAAGWALAAQLKGEAGLGIAIVGDGELQEGLVWETLQIAQAKRVGQLIVLIDANGGQNDGSVEDISPLTHLPHRLRAFGMELEEVDGHDAAAILAALAADRQGAERPLAVLAHTVKGKGVPAIEGKAACHYMKLPPRRAEHWKRVIDAAVG